MSAPDGPDAAPADGGDAGADSGCRAFDAHIAALDTSGVSTLDGVRVRAHLATCARCRDLAVLFEGGSVDSFPSTTDPDAPMGELAEGAVIAGRYRLDRLLGGGGMGVVWAATQTTTRQPVAIKFLRAAGERARRRLLREARAVCAVRHVNVVRAYDVLELADGSPALVMERLEGRSLQEVFEGGRVPLRELCRILDQVAAALEAAHAAGVVHRDLKPDNVFLTADGATDVRLLDFGIAKHRPLDQGVASGTLTSTGAIVGTPFYMSPEQALGEQDVDARADVWALGLLLYQGASGVLPTRGENLGQVIKAIAITPFEPLERLVPDLPEEIAALAGRLLAKARADRPALAEVREVLARYGETSPSSPSLGATIEGHGASAPSLARSAARASPPRSRRLGSLAGLVVGALCIAVAGPPALRALRPKTPASPAFADHCIQYYVDWDLCYACAKAEYASCPQTTPECPANVLPDCEAACYGAETTAGRPAFSDAGSRSSHCGCLEACLKDCAGVIESYYACLGRACESTCPSAAHEAHRAADVAGPCPPDMVLVEGTRPQPSFCMDRTEVTTGAYAACVEKGACTPADTKEVSTVPRQRTGRHSQCNYAVPGLVDRPINCVTWAQSDAYCRAVGKRLPSAGEWRWAARGGTADNRFAWGNDPPTEDQICWHVEETCPVGGNPGGATPTGIMDLAGNVWERTDTPGADPGTHVACGGGIYERDSGDVTIGRSNTSWDAEQFQDLGFRCVK